MGGGGGGAAVPLCMQEEIQGGNWKRIWGERSREGEEEEGEVLKGRWWWCWGRKRGEGMWGDAVSSSCMQVQLWAVANSYGLCWLFCLFPLGFWWLAQAFLIYHFFDWSLLYVCVCLLGVRSPSTSAVSMHMSGTQTQLPQKPFCIWCSKAGYFLLNSLRFCTLIHQAEWKRTIEVHI